MKSLTGFVFFALAIVSSNVSAQSNQEFLWDLANAKTWRIEDDGLRAKVTGRDDTRALVESSASTDVLIRTEVLFSKDSPRHNFGIVFRDDGQQRLALRYYDVSKTLELLEFEGSQWRRVGERSATIILDPNRWYTMKVAAAGESVNAKLWPSDEKEPDWQSQHTVDQVSSGRYGLLVHDAGNIEFRKFSAMTEAPALAALKKEAQELREARHQELLKSLSLAVAAESFPREKSGMRVVEVTPFANIGRVQLAGSLTWTLNGQRHQREIGIEDYDGHALAIEVPEPTERVTIDVEFKTSDGIELASSSFIEPAKLKPWRDYVQRSLTTLIEHGRDDYGPIKTPLIMAVLDTATLHSPPKPEQLDASVRLEGRIHRRGEQGCNLWYDQSLINAMRRLTKITTDEKYDKAADQYIAYFLKNCNKAQDARHAFHTGLPAWGTHVYWSCYEERPAGDQDGSGPHEILVFRANWEDMYRVAPHSITRIADRVWAHHIVDKNTGLHNRHDDGKQGCDFAFSGGSFIHLFASMYKLTGKPQYLEQAKTVANWHWKNRNPVTNLPADCPGLTSRYDGNHTFTTVSGPHAMLLLEAYRATNDQHFFDIAATYIKAYDKYGWDEKEETYYAMLTLDGVALPDRTKGDGYGAYAPYGHVNVWRTTFYSYEFALSAAQSAILAYELSGSNETKRDKELLSIAKRWAGVISRAMPAHTGRRWKTELESSMPRAKETGGAYAEDYGRAISFFVHLFRATGEKQYLGLADQLAEDAVRKLFHNGLFKGHSAKPYYESTNGVGLLLFALLELDSPNEPMLGAL